MGKKKKKRTSSKRNKSKKKIKKKKRKSNQLNISSSTTLTEDQGTNYANCPVPFPKDLGFGSLGPAQPPLVHYNQANITQNIYNNINPQTLIAPQQASLNQLAYDLVASNQSMRSRMNVPQLNLPNITPSNNGNQQQNVLGNQSNVLFSKQKERQKKRGHTRRRKQDS